MKQHNTIAIQLTGVSKKYEIHHEKPTLVEKFVKGPNETFWALRDINLTIKKGERVGFIGPNGSGKTTLLKIIAGITTPSKGSVQTQGKIVSLIDLEAGFHEDLTGIQNIYLNGMLLGMTKNELDQKLHLMIRFADIKQFIDAPLYTYSKGMKLRLGFAVVVYASPDILILDENISVGDKDFQNRSQKKLRQFLKQGKTILMVSHWLEFIEKNCDRILYIHNGLIQADGKTLALQQYKKTP
jgi:ABC-type polysaccharide/polyol phosphate transport system ATPase subunit